MDSPSQATAGAFAEQATHLRMFCAPAPYAYVGL